MIRLLVAALLLVAAGSTGWLLYDAGYLEREGLVEWAGDSGILAPLIVMGAMMLAVVVGPIPTVPISVASGLLFGPVMGFGYAMLGALLGAAASFWIARLAGRPVMERFFGGHASFCRDCSDRMLFWVVLGTRLIPVISFALVSYGAGLTAMSIRAFLTATAIGMVPMTFVYVAIGAQITVNVWWAAGGSAVALLLLLALPRIVERYNPFGLRRYLGHAGISSSLSDH